MNLPDVVEFEEWVDELLAAKLHPGKLELLGEVDRGPANGELQSDTGDPGHRGTVEHGDERRRAETRTVVVVCAVFEHDSLVSIRNTQDNLAVLELRELIRFE